MKTITAKTVRAVTIWVRSDEEDPADFIYRAVKPENGSIQCYDPLAHRDARANWTIVSSSALALRNCANQGAPADAGTLYVLTRAQ